MEDILFDIINREIVFDGSGSNSDFSITQNPSCQNGGILMYGRAFNIYKPIFGIAVEEFMNGNQTSAGQQMSRWQQQVVADGGKGSYKTSTNPNDIDFIIDVNYLQ